MQEHQLPKLVSKLQVDGETRAMVEVRLSTKLAYARNRVALECIFDDGELPFELQRMFAYYCSFGAKDNKQKMTSTKFTKFFQECPKLVTRNLTDRDIELVFFNVKRKEDRHIGYSQFMSAAMEIAGKKYSDQLPMKFGFGITAQQGKMLRLFNNHICLSPVFEKCSLELATTHENLHHRVQSKVNGAATKIQCCCRGKTSQKMATLALERLKNTQLAKYKTRSAVQIQAFWRCYCQVFLFRTVLRNSYSKFTDLELNAPFWFNSATGSTSWKKPDFFGPVFDMDVAIPLPRPESQLTRYCTKYPSKIATFARVTTTRFFDEAMDLFSSSAKDRLPPNERGAKVDFAPVALCQQCNFQIASRKDEWDDCYCDTCYTAVFGSSAQLRKWTFLVQMCSECGDRPAQFSLEESRDAPLLDLESHVIENCSGLCYECFGYLHPETDPYTMPLCTISMLDAHKALANKLDKKLKDAALAESRVRVEEAQRLKAAILLQTIWRGSKDARMGRTHMNDERQARATHASDGKIRKGWKYKAQNLVGKAPELETDSMEERLAKSQPVWKRVKLPEGIGNVDVREAGKKMNFSDMVNKAKKVRNETRCALLIRCYQMCIVIRYFCLHNNAVLGGFLCRMGSK